MLSPQSGFLVRIPIALLALSIAAAGPSRVVQAAPDKPPTDEVAAYVTVPATDDERGAMRRSLVAVVKSLPGPASGFRLAPDGASEDVGRMVLKLEGSTSWGPIDASAERIYDRTDASDDEDRTMEVRTAINGTKGLSTGLASVGGTPRPFELAGAFALEQTLIGVDDEAGGGSRVALPIDEDQAGRSVALLRIYVVPKTLEDRLRALAKGADAFPPFDATFTPATRRAATRAIVVEIHGQKRDVEAYARRIRVADLRKRIGS